MDRTVETILAEWRAAEARLKDDPSNPELQELVVVLRNEHAAAIEARRSEANELLGRSPGSPGGFDPGRPLAPQR